MGVAFLAAAVLQLRRAGHVAVQSAKPTVGTPSAPLPSSAPAFPPIGHPAAAPLPAPAAGSTPTGVLPPTVASAIPPPSAAVAGPADMGLMVAPGDDPMFAHVRALLAQNKDNAAAYKAARELLREHPADPRSHLYVSLGAFRTGDYQRAGQELDQTLSIKQTGKATTPAPMETLVYGGLVAYGLGRFAQAAGLWQAAVAGYPPLKPKLQPLIESALAKAGSGGVPAKP